MSACPAPTQRQSAATPIAFNRWVRLQTLMKVDRSFARRDKAAAEAAREKAGIPEETARTGPRIIDISPPISPAISVWPGDTPYKSDKISRIKDGAGIDLGHMHTTYHVGAHTDAPQHYHAQGVDVSKVPLSAYYGPCQVVEAQAQRGKRFGLPELKQVPASPRVLFKTGTFPDPTAWNNDFAAPAPALIDAMAERGVVLVGFDTPSTDLFASKGLESHQRLFARGMMNLEGLVLSHVVPGHYTLLAMPLRLEDADASPVRAVLIQE